MGRGLPLPAVLAASSHRSLGSQHTLLAFLGAELGRPACWLFRGPAMASGHRKMKGWCLSYGGAWILAYMARGGAACVTT